ncbi:MAG: hypothetical protein HRU13_04750 [Phycisphaerales bacterium]|nr:hypothetical protein [Phycisphaerales bacterium]
MARPLSTLFAVADLDDQVYLWVAGCEIHACTMEDLIRYRLDLLYWESQLTFVFDANLSWFGAISDEDDIYLYGDWERAKRV